MGGVGPKVERPATLGDLAVGVRTITVDDPSRHRAIPVEVWYPAAAAAPGEAAAPATYAVRSMGGTIARLRSPAGARRDAAPVRAGPAPVVVVSHGSRSTRFGNVTLSEILASHGYVVAAPDHPGDTIDDGLFGISDDRRARNTLDRMLDLSRVLDALDRRSHDSGSFLAGLIDVRRVAVAGHSFGGTTALGVVGARFDAPRQASECRSDDSDRRCRVVSVLGPRPYRYRDPRVKAAILIEPGGFDLYRADGVAAVDAPALVVGGLLDHGNRFDEYPKPIYDALESPRYLLRLANGGHLTPTDACEMIDSIGLLAKWFGGRDAADGCGGPAAGFMSTREANDVVARAALAFLDRYLNQNPSAESELTLALSPARTRRTARTPGPGDAR
jgi:predicted dienelactone hydrolase